MRLRITGSSPLSLSFLLGPNNTLRKFRLRLTVKKPSNRWILAPIAQLLRPTHGNNPFNSFVQHNNPVGYGIDARKFVRDNEKRYPEILREVQNEMIQAS
jgi:hypothetical protein